ncbi:Polysialic acid capsule expression protein [Sugiyamaella lignohabitans]|uniref:Polysialic acid capsule expression protein n=1 Tax=Sugiyamaella lignohabitans TaxID=796027 RepID=A0A167DDW2_9ASCO|nr:Polysialic acid capsule expression protein [Sugiyamaella lignohabitans]ANB12804.1 Polysialic acid capsule expression protein [Sugiyamaella lignohabitans]
MYSAITPPSEASPSILATAKHFLKAQANALIYLSSLYDSDQTAQDQFFSSLQYMYNAILTNGKIIVTGMGKSFKIADKLVATMNSLGIHAASLHPSDALHGDLGVVRPSDVLIMITSSGTTPELTTLLNHIPRGLVVLCLTCSPQSPLAKASHSVLSAQVPDHLSEVNVYGLAAPTITTTACLAVGDAICITLAEMLVADEKTRRRNFGKWHPGGAIGQSYIENKTSVANGGVVVTTAVSSPPQCSYVDWSDIGIIDCSPDQCDELNLLRACAGTSWVLFESTHLASSSNLLAGFRNKANFAQRLYNKSEYIAISSLPRISQSQLQAEQENLLSQIYVITDSTDTPIGVLDRR